jgi:hypothetical protein
MKKVVLPTTQEVGGEQCFWPPEDGKQPRIEQKEKELKVMLLVLSQHLESGGCIQ